MAKFPLSREVGTRFEFPARREPRPPGSPKALGVVEMGLGEWMRCDFIGPESSLWNRFLADAPHDFYHLPKYVALSARDRLSAPDANGQAIAFHAEDDDGHRFLATLIVRPLPKTCETSAPLFDAITP